MSAPASPRKTRRTLAFAACLMATFTVAIESTIVATSMPSIVSQLGGFKLYAWVFSIFLLTQAVTLPIYGKLADVFGRKPVFSFGLVVFALGSLLCGFATSLEMLIAFRFVQGIGAGAINPLAMTVVADLYSVRERGKLQGYLSAVWGLSAIAGPLAGGALVQYAHWAWVFWSAVFFALAALIVLNLNLHEDVSRRSVRNDYAGAALIFVCLSALILALTLAGDWSAIEIAGMLLLASAAFALLLWHERRAPDPIIHLELWTKKLMARANVTQGLAGMVLIGQITLLPVFLQAVTGSSALVAGLALAAGSIGWSISSTAFGPHMYRLGTRNPLRAGGVSIALGAGVLAFGAPHGAPVAAGGSLLIGLGMGLLNMSIVFAIQSSVGWAERASATASNVLTRIAGNAIGASLFGGIVNFGLQRYLEAHGENVAQTMERVRGLMSGASEALRASAAESPLLQQGLAGSLQLAMLGLAVCGLLTCLAAWSVPAVDLRAAEKVEERDAPRPARAAD